MKRCCLLLCFIAVSALGIPAQETQPSAWQLVVQVFSSQHVSSLTITPLDRGDWMRLCRGCKQEPVTSSITAQIQSGKILLSSGARAQEVALGGAFRMQAAGMTNPIAAVGAWELTAWHGGMRVLLTLDSERYVAFALEGEAAPNEPLESLKAVAVAMRTFALENANRHSGEGFNLCDSTHCQALGFAKISPQVEEAVLDTAGETLWYRWQPARVFYTQNCGGETADAGEVWPQLHAPYLVAHRDPYCTRHASSQWHADIPMEQLQTIFHNQGWRLPAHIDAVHIVQRTAAGRAKELEFSGADDHATVSASSLHFAVDRSLGWNQIRSDWYTAAISNHVLHLDGRGYGHGVGLCQAGAFEMATEGHSYRDILAFYFPGTLVGFTLSDRGWQQVQGAGWTLWSADPSPALLQNGNAAWGHAQTLFPPRAPVHPVVRQFSTTELFRQSTAQPGWMFASALDTQIFLQSQFVLQKGKENATLLHEFLHVLVERESSPKAPLWLREGVVEVLAESSAPHSSPAPIDFSQLDRALAHPATEVDSQRAHKAAAQATSLLLSRYGMEQIRQWLRSGNVPDAARETLAPSARRDSPSRPR